MSLILFWAEVEEKEDDVNSVFPALMKWRRRRSLFSQG
jgi:hypothetical protein